MHYHRDQSNSNSTMAVIRGPLETKCLGECASPAWLAVPTMSIRNMANMQNNDIKAEQRVKETRTLTREEVLTVNL